MEVACNFGEVSYNMFAFEIIAAVWFFVLGTVFGSFMNVVVYRTPRGKSIVGPSQCPRCEKSIRWYDNVPVLGWLWLRGKCRDCGLPISPRYPVVEFVTGCLFLVLAIAELFSGGMNLPGFAVDWSAGFAGVIADTNWTLVQIFILHVWLLATLFCWGLIRVDEMAIPRGQIFGMWIIVIAAVIIWPHVLPWGYNGEVVVARGDAFRTSVYGFVVAGAIYLIWTGLQRWVSRGGESKAQNTAFAAAMTSIGLALGWQAVVSVLFLTALSRGIFTLSSFRSRSLRRTPLLMDMMLATVIHLCFWSRLWMLTSWPGAGSMVMATSGTGIALLVLMFTAPPNDMKRESDDV